EALYLLGMSAEALGQRELAARTYRELRVLVPASDYAEGGADRLAALEAAGVRVAPLTIEERIDRAERLLRGGVSATSSEEAERIVAEAREPKIVLRALRVVVDSAKKVGRSEVAARALQLAITTAPADERPALELERGKLLVRAGQNQKALVALDGAAATGGETEASEALHQRARILDDIDRRAEAATAYRLVVTRYPSREVAATSLWHLGWLAWLAGDARGAAENWTRLTEPGVDRGYRVLALYWAARARAQQGVAELEDVAERASSDPVRLYAVSSAYVREERYHLALRIFRRSLNPLAVTGDPALPQAFWETFYPFGWRSEVMEAAARSGLDPYLIAAVVREESSYYPRALSRAGA